MSKRPSIEDYEYYDPQQMQEYVYLVEKYVDELEEQIRSVADIARRHSLYNDSHNYPIAINPYEILQILEKDD